MDLSSLNPRLRFAEGLRWHDGALWLSDFITREVLAIDAAGVVRKQAYAPGQPSGLGFLPDGTPLVVSMLDRKLLRIVDGNVEVVASLAAFARGPCNDMAVDAHGNAYIGDMGYEAWYENPQPSTSSGIIRVSAAGSVTLAADGLRGPNGMGFLPGGKRLVVAETHACRLTVFDVAADGSLKNPTLFADLGDVAPDGLCVNRNGDVWVAGLYSGAFLLVREGGEQLASITVPDRGAITCILGGTDGRQLFCATAVKRDLYAFKRGEMEASVEIHAVEVPA